MLLKWSVQRSLAVPGHPGDLARGQGTIEPPGQPPTDPPAHSNPSKDGECPTLTPSKERGREREMGREREKENLDIYRGRRCVFLVPRVVQQRRRRRRRLPLV